jgi:hypothetical protein
MELPAARPFWAITGIAFSSYLRSRAVGTFTLLPHVSYFGDSKPGFWRLQSRAFPGSDGVSVHGDS